MLREYFEVALRKAHYELMEDGRYWGEIPVLQGVWAVADSLEACRDELLEVVEEWTLISYWRHVPLPVLDGIDPNLSMEPEAESDETPGIDSETAPVGIPGPLSGQETSSHDQGQPAGDSAQPPRQQ
jgi:predicted RNase H-like HicB family nuclease